MKFLQRRIKSLLALVVSGAMIIACAGCGSGSTSSSGSGEAGASSAGSGEVYTLSWAGIGATDAIDTWIGEEIAARVAEQTDNQVQITVYPASQLGDLTQAYEEIMAGSIDMGLFTVYGSYDMVQEAVYTPLLTDNLDDFRRVYGKDGFLYQEVAAADSSRGVSLLGFWPSGYLGLGFTKMAETSDQLFDPETQKAELLRVPGMETMMKSAQAIGFKTTTINYSDVYTSLQTGVCDGSWNGGAYANYQGFRDVLKYYADYRICNDVYSLVMNTDKLESMPAEYQEILTTVADEVLEEGIDKIGEQEEQSLKDMADYGIEVIVPTDEQRANLREYFIENVWPSFAEYYGQEFMDQLTEAAG